MARAKVVSDRPAKAKCKEWLESLGFTDVKPAKNQSCDLIARKANRIFYVEIKYSSKEAGSFFGTVMLTEMFKAISNIENYLFLVCRGKGDDINDWSFRLFSVEDFFKCCTLTTPIFLYHLDVEGRFALSAPNFTENTTPASEELVKQMWKDFQKWKSKSNPSKGGK
jgi:Holliday junction resolvase-like predicted endonuclease